MKKLIKPCPFCGCVPEVKGGIVTHRHKDDICIVDDTQYDLKKWNKRADGWISVKDRLPKPNTGETFIVYINEASIQTSWYSQDEDFLTPEFDYTDVTHWMPLPEAPKK